MSSSTLWTTGLVPLHFECRFFLFVCLVFGATFTHPQRNCFSVTEKFPLSFTAITSELNTFKNTELMESVETLGDILMTCRQVFQTIRIFDL